MGRGLPPGARGRHRCRSARSMSPPRSRRSGGCSTSGSPARGVYLWLSSATTRTAASTDRRRSRFLLGSFLAGPLGRGRGRSGPAGSRRSGGDRPTGGVEVLRRRARRGGRIAVRGAPRLAPGAGSGRRRRPVHDLPRLDPSSDRCPPAAVDWPTWPRPGHRPDEARPLRRGDHRGGRPRRLGADTVSSRPVVLGSDFLAHERDVGESEADDGHATRATTCGITSSRLWSNARSVGTCCAACCACPSDPGRSTLRVAARVEQDRGHLANRAGRAGAG